MKRTLITFLIVATIFAPYAVVNANIDAQSAFKVRVDNYKRRYPVVLTEDESRLIISRCEETKEKIVKTRDSVNSTTLKREDTYGDIERRLSAIQSRFSKQGIDTSVIDLMLASYRIEVSNYKKNADEYQIILSDMVAIDCKTDPVAMKSAILSARNTRQSLKLTMSRVKEIYNTQVVNGFDLLKKQLYER